MTSILIRGALPKAGPRRSVTVVVALLAAVVCALSAASARADFGIRPDPGDAAQPDFHADLFDQAGNVDTQAGGHPFAARTSFSFNTTPDPGGTGAAVTDENVKDVVVDLPAGLVGNPQSTPMCTDAELAAAGGEAPPGRPTACPVDSQVGITTIRLMRDPGSTLWPQDFTTPVYNMKPHRGEVAAFGFVALYAVPVRLVASVRTGGDYGLRITVPNISQTMGLMMSSLEFWGVPAAPEHQPERGLSRGCVAVLLLPPNGLCSDDTGDLPSSVAPKPFLTAPVDCGHGRFATSIRVASWQRPEDWKPYEALSQSGVTGCDRLTWEPSMDVRPGSSEAGAPTGLSVDLSVPQNDNPNGLGTPYLDRASVTLPEGMAINPAVADGLGGCSDAQVDLSSDRAPDCPPSSKIGTVRIDTPLLAHPMTGSAYLGTPASDDPASGRMYRLFLVASAEGVLVKLPGAIVPDPATGRLTATFDDNPQLPFDNLHLELKGGPRAPLVNPTTCGTHSTVAELTSWSGQTASSESSFATTCAPGAGGFEPRFSAGVADPSAGTSSTFTLTLSRPDGQQDISGLDVTLPPGLLGNVASVPVCAEVQAAVGACGPESRVGDVTVLAGAGSAPLQVPQPGRAPTAVYLAGPYRGAPYSLSIVVPAQAGPFDLGTVVVRAALFVDVHDAHVTAVSDPIPTILKGVPLRVQTLRVTLGRPGFMRNPTGCSLAQVAGAVTSAAGAAANVASRFQVAGCDSLRFAPKLDLALTNRSQTKDGGHPGVLALVRQGGGESAIEGARVELPLHLALDPDNANGLCEYEDGLRSECPAASVVGRAVAVSPILRQPLTGPVYFVKGVRFNARGERVRTLPTLLVKLTGENGLRLDLRARSDIDDDTGQLVNTFENVPDAPISSFSLQIDGGKHGILVVTHDQDICKPAVVPEGVALTDHPGVAIAADADFSGHSGKAFSDAITIATPCSLQVYSRAYKGNRMSVSTGGFMGPGTLKVSGSGIKTTSRKIAGESTDMATIAASLTATGKRLRKQHRTLKIRVSFDPKAKGQGTETVSYPKVKKGR